MKKAIPVIVVLAAILLLTPVASKYITWVLLITLTLLMVNKWDAIKGYLS
jgi:hypothetical protein